MCVPELGDYQQGYPSPEPTLPPTPNGQGYIEGGCVFVAARIVV